MNWLTKIINNKNNDCNNKAIFGYMQSRAGKKEARAG